MAPITGTQRRHRSSESSFSSSLSTRGRDSSSISESPASRRHNIRSRKRNDESSTSRRRKKIPRVRRESSASTSQLRRYRSPPRFRGRSDRHEYHHHRSLLSKSQSFSPHESRRSKKDCYSIQAKKDHRSYSSSPSPRLNIEIGNHRRGYRHLNVKRPLKARDSPGSPIRATGRRQPPIPRTAVVHRNDAPATAHDPVFGNRYWGGGGNLKLRGTAGVRTHHPGRFQRDQQQSSPLMNKIAAPSYRPPPPARLPMIDRTKTCPFLLRAYYKLMRHHSLEDFNKYLLNRFAKNEFPASNLASDEKGDVNEGDETVAAPPPEPSEDMESFVSSELQLYTWKDTSLREIVDLVKDLCPQARIRSSRISLKLLHLNPRGTYSLFDLGTLHNSRPGREDRRTLLRSRFEIGDVVSIAIFPGGGNSSYRQRQSFKPNSNLNGQQGQLPRMEEDFQEDEVVMLKEKSGDCTMTGGDMGDTDGLRDEDDNITEEDLHRERLLHLDLPNIEPVLSDVTKDDRTLTVVSDECNGKL